MHLTWADFDLDEATLRVRPELGKSKQERRGRRVPISPHLVDLLRAWGPGEGYVVESRRFGTGPRARQERNRDMRRAWERSGARPEAYRQPHHCFRKGFVSELRRAGADPDAIEVLVGHSLGLRGVYTDPAALPMREAVGLIPAIGAAGKVMVMRR